MTREPGPVLPRSDARPQAGPAAEPDDRPGDRTGARARRRAGTAAAEPDRQVASRVGHSRALTVMTPLPRAWSPVVKLVLKVKSWQGPDPTLQRLSFIHVAHWVVIDRFPKQDGRSRYAYLLFVSNFNGSWREYIDAFSTAIPRRMALLWGSSFGFPGAWPPKPFVRYIARNQVPPDHYYAAYPEATATEIGSAMRVRDQFHEAVLPVSDEDDEEFGRAWRAFVRSAQRDL